MLRTGGYCEAPRSGDRRAASVTPSGDNAACVTLVMIPLEHCTQLVVSMPQADIRARGVKVCNGLRRTLYSAMSVTVAG
jgi:hypothetical protein